MTRNLIAVASSLAVCLVFVEQKGRADDDRGPVKYIEWLNASDLKVGTAGVFYGETVMGNRLIRYIAPLRVEEVIGAKRMIVSVDPTPGVKVPRVIVANFDTKDVADGQIINPSPTFKVTATEKYNGRTYHVVEPYTPPKK